MNTTPSHIVGRAFLASVAFVALGVAVGGMVRPTEARADELSATLGQPLTEVSHTVDVRVRDGVATLVVRRAFANRGTRHDEVGLLLELPPFAAATGLRIRGKDRWYDGELMDAERAAELYLELTGIGPHSPRDPALLWWVWPDELMLQVFPVAPGRVSLVEYTLTLPTRYTGGRYVLPCSYASRGLAPVVVRVDPQTPGDGAWIDGRPVAAGEPVVMALPEQHDCPAPPGEPAPVTCAVSTLTVDLDRPVVEASVDVSLRHTYRGDLDVWLVAPNGTWHQLLAQEGDSTNDVRESFPVTFDPPIASLGEWRLVVQDDVPQDTGTLDRWSLYLDADGVKLNVPARDVPVFVPDAPDDEGEGTWLANIEVAAPPIDTLAARYDRLVVSEEHTFARLEWDAAPQLRPLPKAPSVVFVVDASHSVEPDGVRAQLRLAQAYLLHVPDAAVEIVAFRRRAERVFGGFEPRAAVDPLLAGDPDATPLPRGNGSALDEGLRLAVETLRDRPGPRRVVVMTDALLRSGFETEHGLAALGGLAPDDVVHVVLPQVGDEDAKPSDRRDDDHDLAPIADGHGGVLLHVVDVPLASPEPLRSIALGLVRPIRIDQFAVEGLEPYDVPEVVPEGSGFRSFEDDTTAPDEVVLRGRIWAAPFERRLAAPAEASAATAAFVFSHDLHDDLTPDEQRRVAFLGGAVSPVTSYLAIEPGVRPSRAGIERAILGRGLGARGRSVIGRIGCATRPRRPSLADLLQPAIDRCVAAHPPSGRQGEADAFDLEVETTLDEIVDVSTVARGPLATCVVEAIWAFRLPQDFRSFEREIYPIAVP